VTRRRLLVLAKEPVAGRVKTRLAARLGDEAAARLYEAFLSDLAEELTSPGEWESILAHADGAAGPALRRLFGPEWSLAPQGGGDLGERLARAFEGVGDGAAVVVVGSDAPTLSRADVRRAFAELERGAQVVLAPSPDGGYSLVGMAGMARPEAVFIGVRWSTEHALHDTLEGARRSGLVTRVIDEVADVDTAEGLEALRALLAVRVGVAPRTRRALEAAGERG
jgi:rSAM/selenodomain-associated transferase 1